MLCRRILRGPWLRLQGWHAHHHQPLMRQPRASRQLNCVHTESQQTCQQLKVYVPSESGMVDLASLLAHQELHPGDVYCLYGEVGAGKSVFSRAFIRAVACDEQLPVPSPTFLLQNTYEADTLGEECPPIHHFDLYRLADTPAQSWERLNLSSSFKQAVCLVEWPERLPANLLPLTRMNVAIAITSSTIEGTGASQQQATVHESGSSDESVSGDEDEVDVYTDRRPRVVTFTAVGNHWQHRLSVLETMIKDPDLSSTHSIHVLQ